MDPANINRELELQHLKNKLLMTLKYYLHNIPQPNFSCFYKILELLKQKYTNAYDFNFLEQGIQSHIQNNHNNVTLAITNMSSSIYVYNNEHVLKDLLHSIDTGFNYPIETKRDNLEK
jgi:hypothetical protein